MAASRKHLPVVALAAGIQEAVGTTIVLVLVGEFGPEKQSRTVVVLAHTPSDARAYHHRIVVRTLESGTLFTSTGDVFTHQGNTQVGFFIFGSLF